MNDLDARIEAVRAKGADVDRVSYPCTIGRHEDCTGRVLLFPGGEFVKCECPFTKKCACPNVKK